MAPTLPPTIQQIQGLIGRLRDKRGERPRYVGLQSGVIWQGPSRISVDGDEYHVRHGSSGLEIREHLLNAECEGQCLVIVTSLDPHDLGDDVLGRFCKGSLIPLSPRESLKDVFGAKSLDPFIVANRWFAEAVLESIPSQGVSPVPNGFLDLETAWGLILSERLQLKRSRPDVLDLLEWSSTTPGIRDLLSSLSSELCQGLRDWISKSAGAAGESILDCILAGHGAEAPALGICFYVVSTEGGEWSQQLRDAAVRLERFTANKPLSAKSVDAWKKASVEFLDRTERISGSTKAQSIRERSDWLLRQVGASEFAHLSEFSPSGFEARLKRYAELLLRAPSDLDSDFVQNLADLAHQIDAHYEARRLPERVEKVKMSLRLIRWLKRRRVAESDFRSSIEQFVQDGSYVDWARYYLSFGESLDEVATAYTRLLESATIRREEQNIQFGRLAAEQAVLPDQTGVILIENVLKDAVAPVAKEHPVLLVVVDGMSYSVFRELMCSVIDRGWQLVRMPDQGIECSVIAALPSTTERCRLCLLSGMLESPDDEVAAFRKNQALVEISARSHPPKLFLKGQLTRDDRVGLSNDILNEIASARKVVGAVINAVDDHLHSGDQLFVAWDLSKLPLLEQLLVAAKQAGRWVVVTSDHGHVLDYQSIFRRSEAGADRYRTAEQPPEADEVLIQGFRVGKTLGGRFVAPCSEKIYYASRKNGYHGGVAPQELIVPLAVLAADTFDVGTWVPVPLHVPSWWSDETAAVEARTAATLVVEKPKPAPEAKVKAQEELPLFAATREPKSPPTAAWISRLLTSTLFAKQCELAGRTAPRKDQVRLILVALNDRGGVILKNALSQRVQVPGLRMNGVLAVLRRILNIDGYPVLTVDEDGETIRLNRQLLLKQFELE
jgi:PglZ domain